MDTRWLIRTRNNKIYGPLPQAALTQKILAGELHARDEVCQMNGYWISLFEESEIQAQLGITPPQESSDEGTEEITQTDTLYNLEASLAPETHPKGTRVASLGSSEEPTPGDSRSEASEKRWLILVLGILGLILLLKFFSS